MGSRPATPDEQRLILELTFLYVFITIAIMAVVTIAVWGRTDPIIAYVPVPILEWAFLGGMVAVVYRLGFQRKRFVNLTQLYTWAIAKPLIGLVMGGVVYFLAVAGQIYYTGGTTLPLKPELFNVIAFIAAFSDRWSIDLIEKFTEKTGLAEGEQAVTPQEPVKEGEDQAKEGGEPAAKTPPVK
jgi:hypothetical protein